MNDRQKQNSPSEQLLIWQRRLMVAVLCLLLLLIIFQFAGYFSDLLRILGISILLSYLFINVVDWLSKYLRSRAAAVAVVYLLLGVLLAAASILLVPVMAYQVSQLVSTTFTHIPDFIEYLRRIVSPLEAKFHAAQIQINSIDILYQVAMGLPRPDPTAIFSKVGDLAQSAMAFVVYGISILMVSFYFLLEGSKMNDGIIGLFPQKHRIWLTAVAGDADKSLQSFFRGQIVLAMLSGAVMLLVYLLLDIKYALLLGFFLGVWEIVPVIGPPIGFIPTIFSVAVHGMNIPGPRLIQILIITAIFLVLQNLKDNVIAPKYLGNVIGLHPVLIFIAIMIGARIDGFLGIIFALPAACVVNTVFEHLRAGTTS